MTSYYFKPFPTISYDLGYTGKSETVTNVMLRFKINEVLKQRPMNYYNYTIPEGDRPDNVAFSLYGDPKLSWLLLIVNNFYDPFYEWPLSYRDFISYLRSKYGKVETAQSTVHEYRKILNRQSELFDGTIVRKRTLVVDQTTYDSLPTDEREVIYKYDYEDQLNESRRNILYPPDRLIPSIVSDVQSIFE